MKDWVANEIWTLIEELLDDILNKSLQIVQSGILSVGYKFVEQLILDLLPDIIEHTFNAQELNPLISMQPPTGCHRGFDLEHNHGAHYNIRDSQIRYGDGKSSEPLL